MNTSSIKSKKKDISEIIGAIIFGVVFLGMGIAFLWLPFVGEFNIIFLVIIAIPGLPFTVIGFSAILLGIESAIKRDNMTPLTME